MMKGRFFPAFRQATQTKFMEERYHDMKRKTVTVVAGVLIAAASLAVAASALTLPKGYQKWRKSRQHIVNDRKSLFYGIHYTYVDARAMKTFEKGDRIPRGAGLSLSSLPSLTRAENRSRERSP